MWVWDRPGPAALVDFAHRQSVGDLFVSTPGGLASSPELRWFRRLRARTASAGLRLQALGAEPGWLDEPAAARAWQRQALGSGLFDGVHLDVEPWLHPRWPRAAPALLSAWVDLLALLQDDAAVPVEADIPFWLHEHPVGGRPGDEAVMSAVDAVTVMSYRTTVVGPDSVTGVAAAALATAQRLRRPVRLAVETRRLDDPAADKQTFHGASRRELGRALEQVTVHLDTHPTYRGVAVHDHRGWVAMAP